MNKQEALAVMHEVLGVLGESVVITGVSFDRRCSRVSKNPDCEGFLIRMRCDLDNYSVNGLRSILDRHGLVLKEENGFVTISKICP